MVGQKAGFLSRPLTNPVNTRILYCIWTLLQRNLLLPPGARPKKLPRRGFAFILGT